MNADALMLIAFALYAGASLVMVLSTNARSVGIGSDAPLAFRNTLRSGFRCSHRRGVPACMAVHHESSSADRLGHRDGFARSAHAASERRADHADVGALADPPMKVAEQKPNGSAV